jgi:UDP-4-amino-4,6-dideoxy-N-acetyl-beta-L-altrosamine N-acetyltransferase
MLKFVKMRADHLELVLRWRTQPEVTRYMVTDVKNDLNEQKKWFERVFKSPDFHYWLISHNDRLVGLANIASLSATHKRCSLGYYIGESDYRQMGAFFLPYLYNHVFGSMGLHKLYGEVLDGNPIVKIHELHGYRRVGTLRDHVFKYGKFHDLHIVELLAETWKRKVHFQGYIAPFE